MGVTIKDVAKRAGVATATAARVLGDYGYTSKDTREKVLKAAEELAYNPNMLAKSMITGRTRIIGLIVADIEKSFYATIAKGIGNVITPLGYNLIVISTNECVEEERQAIRFLQQQQVEGMIISPASSTEGESIIELLQSKTRVVLIDRLVDHLDVDVVSVQNTEGAFDAVKHLIAQGHTAIGFLGGSLNVNSHQERLTGYKRALSQGGIRYNESLVRLGSNTPEEAREAAIALINCSCGPTAIFSVNHTVSLGLLSAVKQLRIAVPEKLSIASFDDPEWFPLLNPSITAVKQPVSELGEMAAKQLLRRIEGDYNPYKIIRLPSELVIRDSTGQVPLC